MTDQITALEKRQNRQIVESSPVVYPALLFGPSFSNPAFSIALVGGPYDRRLF